MTESIAPHLHFPESRLAFHPDRSSDTDIHPLRGLVRFGPQSSGLVPDPVRVATIAPAKDAQRLYTFMAELRAPHRPRERTDYLPRWPGFHEVFGIRMQAAAKPCHITLDEELDTEIEGGPNPHSELAHHLVRTIHRLDARRADFDVIFIYLPQRWRAAFRGTPKEDFDLHDHLKAAAAMRGIPIQLIREDKALAYRCRASVAWRVGLALYAKAGGIPWKLADHEEETAFIGISYAVRSSETEKPRFVTCCSQIFDSAGSGLEFVAYDAHEFEVQRRNPFLARTEMFRVMSRSLDLYRRRHAGRSPRRVTVHKTTEFKREEIEGAFEAFHLCGEVDLIQVVEDVGWRGVRMGGRGLRGTGGQPTMWPVHRGTLVSLGPFDSLLWSHGDVSGISSRGPYFQGGRGTPRPIKLVRHAGHGAWDHVGRTTLALSKMNWNNDALYDHLPVTMSYAKVLSRVVKRMSGLGKRPYQFRFFM